jgi:hypothetical protein
MKKREEGRRALIEALLTYPTITEVARAVRLRTEDVHALLDDPELIRELRLAQRHANAEHLLFLKQSAGPALRILVGAMLDTRAPIGVRVRAADRVLEAAGRVDPDVVLKALEPETTDERRRNLMMAEWDVMLIEKVEMLGGRLKSKLPPDLQELQARVDKRMNEENQAKAAKKTVEPQDAEKETPK